MIVAIVGKRYLGVRSHVMYATSKYWPIPFFRGVLLNHIFPANLCFECIHGTPYRYIGRFELTLRSSQIIASSFALKTHILCNTIRNATWPE